MVILDNIMKQDSLYVQMSCNSGPTLPSDPCMWAVMAPILYFPVIANAVYLKKYE